MEFSVAKWGEMCKEMGTFEEEFYYTFSCFPSQLTEDKLQSTRSWDEKLSDWIIKFADIYHRSKAFTESAATKFETLNGQLIQNQEKVIVLQDQLIKSNDEHLVSVQTTVRNEVASIQEAVKSEFCSWSDVVKQDTNQPLGITSTKIKEAVKSAVCEEDRSRNVMIFGKQDIENEDLSLTMSEIFQDLDEKPQLVEYRRIGTARPGKCRPIKVKLSSSEAVSYVLRKAKLLKSSVKNQSTYITADRNQEERDLHKKLIERMKQKIDEEPDMYHYVKGGLITSVRKRPAINGTEPTT
jgi:hypothetical protein